MKKLFILFLALLFIFLCIFIYSKYPVEYFFGNVKPVPELPALTENIFKPHGQWKWEYAINTNGTEIKPKDSNQFILILTPEGRLTSTTDCNDAAGSYIRNGNAMSVGPLVSTKKACEGETFESIYLTYLSLASTYKIEGSTLTIYLVNNSGSMVFSRY